MVHLAEADGYSISIIQNAYYLTHNRNGHPVHNAARFLRMDTGQAE
jgi:hypothetical protein